MVCALWLTSELSWAELASRRQQTSLLPKAVASVGDCASMKFTVSGHSAGGSMASQHLVAFSDRVVGLGHFEAVSYGCSSLINVFNDSNSTYETPWKEKCVNARAATAMYQYTMDAFAAGSISDPSNLRDSPIWLYAGELDPLVTPEVIITAADLYRRFSSQVFVHIEPRATHAIATDYSCALCRRCEHFGPPFITVSYAAIIPFCYRHCEHCGPQSNHVKCF